MIREACSHGDMRPLVISGQTAVQTLQQEIQRSEESRYDHRLHAVLLVAMGLHVQKRPRCWETHPVRWSIGCTASKGKGLPGYRKANTPGDLGVWTESKSRLSIARCVENRVTRECA